MLSSSKAGTNLAFSYDPFHRQAEKSVTTTGIAKTRYIYSGWQRLADYDSVTDSLQNRYVYGTGLDEPLIQVSNSGVLTFLHVDHLGSIIATSDNSGVVTNKNSYGPFGETSGLAGTTFGYTAQRFDSETGLNYFKNRQYSPSLGRFLQPDFIGARLYTYANNDPMQFVDSFGLEQSWPGVRKLLLESHTPGDELTHGCRSLVNYFWGDPKANIFPEVGADCFYGKGAFKSALAKRDELNKDICCKAVVFVKTGNLTGGTKPPDGKVVPNDAGHGYPLVNTGNHYAYFVYQECNGGQHVYSLNGPPAYNHVHQDPNDFIDNEIDSNYKPGEREIWCAKCSKK